MVNAGSRCAVIRADIHPCLIARQLVDSVRRSLAELYISISAPRLGRIPPAMGATGPSSMPPHFNSPISFPLAMKPLKRLKSKLLYGDPFCDITC